MRKIRVHKREERPVATPTTDHIQRPITGYGDLILVGGYRVTDTEFAYAISRYCDANGGGVEAVQNLVESKLGESLPHKVLGVPVTRRTVSDMLRGCVLEVTYLQQERAYVIDLRNVLENYHCQLQVSLSELANLRGNALFTADETRHNHIADRLTSLILDAWRTPTRREMLRMLVQISAPGTSPFHGARV